MELYDIIKAAIGASIPILIFYFGKRWEKKQHEIERRHKNRIRFELDAVIFGPQEGHYIAEISMILKNEGLVRTKLSELLLTVKGIETDTSIGLFMDKDFPISVAHFPVPFVKTNVLNKLGEENEKKKDEEKKVSKKEKGLNKEKEWFVEPGIEQRFTYVARIPEDIRFILVRSMFKYHINSDHSAQKVFEVNPQKPTDKN